MPYEASSSKAGAASLTEPCHDDGGTLVVTAELEKIVARHGLVELHTHLLGMGSADFWLHWIMLSYLRQRLIDKNDVKKSLQDHLRDHIEEQLELNKEEKIELNSWLNSFIMDPSTSEPTLFIKSSDDFVKNMKELADQSPGKTSMEEVFKKHFTFDVVYSDKKLCEAFDIEYVKVVKSEQLAELESKMYVPAAKMPFNKHFRHHIILNCRGKNGCSQFEVVRGFQNEDLVKLMQ